MGKRRRFTDAYDEEEEEADEEAEVMMKIKSNSKRSRPPPTPPPPSRKAAARGGGGGGDSDLDEDDEVELEDEDDDEEAKMEMEEEEEEEQDEEEEEQRKHTTNTKKKKNNTNNNTSNKRKKRTKKTREEEEEEEEEEEKEEEVEEVQEAEVAPEPEAFPVGEVVRETGKGKKKKKHYLAFEYDGNSFEIEDSVLLTPEDLKNKPYVAIIKDITEMEGNLFVTGQWFYRPEEAERRGGGSWEASDTRELFYSFHFDDVPAESVMHKCVVHFVPQNKQLPNRKEHPGFIVRKVYDTIERKLWKLTDTDYEDNKQHEIDVLVQKTKERIGELPDIEPEKVLTENEPLLNKRNPRRRPMSPIDVQKSEDTVPKSDHFTKAETPGSCKHYGLLSKYRTLTGDQTRDKWLDKLLDAVIERCNTKESSVAEGPSKTTKDNDDAGKVYSPAVIVPVITAVERATHEAHSDFQKYNQKMRQLVFNLKNSPTLARRLLKKELDPLVLLTMSPEELKVGLTAEEKRATEPEESRQLQMTDARCSRCTERKVGISEIIHAGGGHGDRYQLECMACGHQWYASRDAISSLTVEVRSTGANVGTAPLATAKFQEVDKKLLSPRDREQSEKAAADVLQKTTEAYMPVLESQKSFNRSKTEDPSVPGANRE